MTDTRTDAPILTIDMREALERVSAAIRDVREGDALAYRASEIVGTLLGASRAGYSRFDTDQDTMITSRDWRASGVVSLEGHLPLSAYGSYIKEMRAGAVVSVTDVYGDPRSGSASALDELHARAVLNVPILENQALVAVFFINMPVVHEWTQAETAFLSEVADRLRVGAERLRIEAEREKLVDELRALNNTLQQRIEEQVAERNLLATLVETTDVVILAADLDYNLLAINKAALAEFERIYGVRPAAGDNMLTLLADQPEHQAQIRAGWGRGLAGEETTFVEEFGDADRDRPYYEVRFRTLRNEAGERIGAYQFVTDVTDRLREQAQLAEAQEALRQSQKVEAIGQLTGGVAHDFNNLLTVIRGSIDLLRRPGLAEEKRARYLDAISDTTDRATRLTSQLLAFARRQALKAETFDAGASINTLRDMIGTLIGSRVTVDVEIGEGSLLIRADRSQFDTAIVNMTVNARDAMAGEGLLTIAVHEANTIPTTRSHAAVSGEFVAVSITDTGSGIEADRVERIFEPFYTTKGVGHGTGLGLGQVYGFAKQSNGEVMVRSEIGLGSTFTLYLPKALDEETPPARIEDCIKPLPSGACILIVEDNSEVGSFATQALTELGYKTKLAVDAEMALAELGSDGNGFDLIFSDVVMPGMSGIELGKEIHRRLPGLPIVLTSGYSSVLAEQDTHEFVLLQKPYSLDELAKTLARVSAGAALI